MAACADELLNEGLFLGLDHARARIATWVADYVPKGLAGDVVVHDGGLAGADHALCNAHHLRELKALIAFDHEPWAERMRDLLLDANRAVGEGWARGDEAPEPPVLGVFETRFWNILREGSPFTANCPDPPENNDGTSSKPLVAQPKAIAKATQP